MPGRREFSQLVVLSAITLFQVVLLRMIKEHRFMRRAAEVPVASSLFRRAGVTHTDSPASRMSGID